MNLQEHIIHILAEAGKPISIEELKNELKTRNVPFKESNFDFPIIADLEYHFQLIKRKNQKIDLHPIFKKDILNNLNKTTNITIPTWLYKAIARQLGEIADMTDAKEYWESSANVIEMLRKYITPIISTPTEEFQRLMKRLVFLTNQNDDYTEEQPDMDNEDNDDDDYNEIDVDRDQLYEQLGDEIKSAKKLTINERNELLMNWQYQGENRGIL